MKDLDESKSFKSIEKNIDNDTTEEKASNLIIIQLGAHDLAHGMYWDSTYSYLER